MQSIANGFNSFFINVGPNLAKNIETIHDETIHKYLPNANKDSMYIIPATEQEILSIVSTFKNKTSNDCEGFSMDIIKRLMPRIIKPVTHIFNTSLSEGIFPNKLKTAKVVPLYKSGDKHQFTNYRSVSILPKFSKIL